jgi:hypothetical protein
MTPVNLYCNCHGEKLPKHTQFLQRNIICGAHEIPQEERELRYEGFLFDDVRENISSLNRHFGELTGLYWVWKNASDEIVGTNQYRIFWNDDQLRSVNFKENSLVIVKRIDVNDYVKGDPKKRLSTYEHFSYCHGDISLILLQGMCRHSDKSRLKSYMIDNLRETSYLSPSNMFIGTKATFDKVCDVLFDILFEYNDTFSYLYDSIESRYGYMRVVDYLAERVLHMMYENKNYFFGNLEITEVEMIEHPHRS